MICVGIDAAKGKRCNAAISYAAKNPVMVICALRKSGQACRTAAAASEPGMKKRQGKQVLPGAKMSRKRSADIEEYLRGAGTKLWLIREAGSVACAGGGRQRIAGKSGEQRSFCLL